MKNIITLFLLLFCSSIQAQDSQEEYYRHLRYNHVSPVIELAFVHPIERSIAENCSHYVVIKDEQGRTIEILNNHYQTEKKHPLASIGAYRTMINHSDTTQIRTYFDIKGNRITNDKGVYKEIYKLNENGQIYSLNFFDLENQKLESNWKIARYYWEYKDGIIIEKRYSQEEEMVNLSPYFDFGITGILLDEKGVPMIHYNLNADLEIEENELGIASYRDKYDKQGNHIEYSYHDKESNLTPSPWKFARGIKKYDLMGNNIGMARYDSTNTLLFERDIPNNINTELATTAVQSDSMEIRRISEGYLRALQKMDPILMAEVMSDSLNKITIGYDRQAREEFPQATTYDQMIGFAKDWNKANNKFPFKPYNDVTILDIYNRIASVKLVSDNWVEYLHLIKLDGKWEIINLIWQHKDVGRYPK